MTSGDIDIGRYRFLRLLAAIAREAAKERITRAGRFCAVKVLAGQGAKCQTGVGQQLNAFILADFRQTHFVAAVQQAVGILDGDDARQVVFIRQVKITHNAKGRFVGDADIADFTGPLEFGERFKRIQQGDNRRGVGPAIA